MFMIFIILLEIITYFSTVFSSFGAHFMTLEKAFPDLITLLLIMAIVMIGFATWANIIKGALSSDFQSYEKTILFLFQYVNYKIFLCLKCNNLDFGC